MIGYLTSGPLDQQNSTLPAYTTFTVAKESVKLMCYNFLHLINFQCVLLLVACTRSTINVKISPLYIIKCIILCDRTVVVILVILTNVAMRCTDN